MITAHLVASTLASLTWLLRHLPTSREEQAATLAHLAALVGEESGLTILAGLESLSINGTNVPIDAPGAHLLNEHLLMQGIRRVEFAAPVSDERVVALCAVLAAYPGTFESFAELEVAAGVGPGLTLAEAPTELIFERELPGLVLLPDSEARPPIEQEDFILRAEEGGLLHYPELEAFGAIGQPERRAVRPAIRSADRHPGRRSVYPSVVDHRRSRPAGG